MAFAFPLNGYLERGVFTVEYRIHRPSRKQPHAEGRDDEAHSVLSTSIVDPGAASFAKNRGGLTWFFIFYLSLPPWEKTRRSRGKLESSFNVGLSQFSSCKHREHHTSCR
jgi:hypothetical protein